MTAEERARKLLSVEIPEGMDEASFGELDEYLYIRIAQAIRQAENDKLEEAAKIADARNHASIIAAEIRSLKKD